MSIIKRKIKYVGKGMNITFPISGTEEYLGYQQEIDNFTQIKSAESINDVTDHEVVRYEIEPSDNRIITFNFFDGNQSWKPEYVTAGFTEEEVSGGTLNYLNSFYILDFFDTTKATNQTKLYTTYLTKLNRYNVVNKNDLDRINYNESEYKFNKNFQLTYLNLPNWYDSSIAYLRISFYNAKTGILSVFFNDDNKNYKTSEKMYFIVVYDKTNRTYQINTNSNTGSNPKIVATELVESTDYLERYNKTFDNFDNISQNYPKGDVFNTSNGKYD